MLGGKTKQPVKFELAEHTRTAIDEYLRETPRKPGHYLFADRGEGHQHLSTRQYARLFAEWVSLLGLELKHQLTGLRRLALPLRHAIVTLETHHA